MLRFSRLCACVAMGMALLCTGCAGEGPPADPPASTSASPSPVADEQALLDKVHAEGRLSVLVTLKLPPTPAGDEEREKAAIADAQDTLLGQLEQRGVQVQTRFERYPLLTLTVDEPVLRYLLVSPLVEHVDENETNVRPS